MDEKTALGIQGATMFGQGGLPGGAPQRASEIAQRPNDVAAVLDRVTDLLELAKTELDDCRRRLELVLRSIGTSV